MTVWSEEIVDTDDPRWIFAEREVMRLFDVAKDALTDLLVAKPTTIGGIVATLRYVQAMDNDYLPEWGSFVSAENEDQHLECHQAFCKTLANALDKISGEG